MKWLELLRCWLLLVLVICLMSAVSSPASNQNSLDTTIFLLMSTGTVSARDSAGGPEWDDTIIEAIKSGNLSQVKKLLNKGGGPNARHRMGGSALRWAAISGHREIVIELLNHGASLNMEQGGALEEQLISSTIRGEWVKVRYLLGLHADINAKAENGETPLHWASVMGYTTLVEVLLVEGADFNSVCRNGCTPLTFAALHGYEQIVKRLLDYGADPGIKGWPADPKALAEQKGHKNIVRLFESHEKSKIASSKIPTESKSHRESSADPKTLRSQVIPPEKLRWIFQSGQDYLTTPVAVDGIAYFAGTSSENSEAKSCIYAVDMDTGREEWKYEVSGSVVAQPKITNNVAYFGSRQDKLDKHWAHAVDIKTRKEKWKFEAQGQVVWISSVTDGTVYLGTLGGYL